MKNRFFTPLLLFSLFGVALCFFGMLYEGVVIIPKMLDTTPQRLQFWNRFYSVLNPIIFYIPLVPIATVLLCVLYFNVPRQSSGIKKQLGQAGIAQLLALALTFYIIAQINLKFYFQDAEKYRDVISSKTLLVNIVSVIRLLFSAIALFFSFKAYIMMQKHTIKTTL